MPRAEILRIARLIEDLKLPCGMDPETPQAIRNGRYQSIALILRAMLAAAEADPREQALDRMAEDARKPGKEKGDD